MQHLLSLLLKPLRVMGFPATASGAWCKLSISVSMVRALSR